MKFHCRDWLFVFALWGLLFAFSSYMFWNLQPVSNTHNKEHGNSDSPDCIRNLIKSVNLFVNAFKACLKTCLAEQLGREPDDTNLPPCITELLRNISLELALLQMGNVSHRRLMDTKEKLLEIFRDMEICVRKTTKRKASLCVETVEKDVLEMLTVLNACAHTFNSLNSYYRKIISCVVAFLNLFCSLKTFLTLANIQFLDWKLPYLKSLGGASFHFSLNVISWELYLQIFLPAMLNHFPFAGRIVHVDMDMAMGRNISCLEASSQEKIKWQYPGEDSIVRCAVICQPYIWTSHEDANDTKIIWLLDGKPIAPSERQSLLWNQTYIDHGMLVALSSLLIYNLNNSDFGKYECVLDHKALHYFIAHQAHSTHIHNIPSRRMKVFVPPRSVLRLQFSFVEFLKNFNAYGKVKLVKNKEVISSWFSEFSKNIESCSTMTIFLDLLMRALTGRPRHFYESMMTLCVSFPHYGLYHLEVERQIDGVRTISRHPVSLEVSRKLGDKVSHKQIQNSDEDLQSSYSALKEVIEIFFVLVLLGIYDVIRVFFTAATIWMFIEFETFLLYWHEMFMNFGDQLHVYVAASSADEYSVKKAVVNFLEALGHKVYFHKRDCPLGKTELSSMVDAMFSHQKFVVVISKDFLEEQLCTYQWEMIINELGRREMLEPNRDCSNQLLIIRSGNVIPPLTLGARVLQWNMSSRSNLPSGNADEDKSVESVESQKEVRRKRAFLAAWLSGCVSPKVSLKQILFASCVVIFSHPGFLVLLPYWSELVDILGQFLRNW